MRRLLCICCAFLSLVAASGAFAQAWPAKPVRFILSQPPGTGPDIISRLLAERLTRTWNQQVVIDNRGGGNNVIGSQVAARSASDGYSYFFATTAAVVINRFTFKSLPYDPERDFVPVAMVAKTPFVLAVNAGVPAKNVAELVALAKAQPGKLSFASDGSRGLAGMLGEMLKSTAAIDIVHVPYGGSVQSIQDTVVGRTQLTFQSSAPVAPFIKSGKLRALAVTVPERVPGMEDIPAMRETFPGFEYFGWYIVFAPTGTPAEPMARVNRDLGAVLKDKEIIDKLASFGSVAEKTPGTPESLRAFMKLEMERWGQAVKVSRIEPE
jgi:tripartite-type tricarboxylate transporter receptor subunit TctC